MHGQESPYTEGQLYGVFNVGGHRFEIHYGYASEQERKSEEALGENIIPLFPDFTCSPMYDESGAPLVTDIQDPCECYDSEYPNAPEQWCRDCKYFPEDKPKIGVCRCKKKAINKQ